MGADWRASGELTILDSYSPCPLNTSLFFLFTSLFLYCGEWCKVFCVRFKLYFRINPGNCEKILHLVSLGTVLNENTEIKHTLHFQLDAIPLDLLCKKACVAISPD